MSRNGDLTRGHVLAMAGRKSPWGGEGAGDGTAEADAAAGGSDEAAGEEPPAAERNAGAARPFNPWLPAQESEPQRRSANIEDILRQRGLRGGRSGGGTRNWLPVVLAGLIAAWIGGTSFHFLAKGEQGLVTTFGKYDRTVGAGLTLTLPWPAQAVSVRNTARIEETVLPDPDGENLMLTRDRQLADVSVKLRWRIADLRRFAYGSADSARMIARLADAEVHAAVAEQRFDDLIDGQRRGQLQQLVASRTQAVLDAWQLGVRVEGAEVVRANPPARLSEAFRKVGEARQEARRKIDDAQARAQQTLGNATTEAAEFQAVYAQYQAAPEITRKRRYYEAMERVLSSNAKVVIGGGGANVTVAPPPVPAASPSASPAAPGGQ